MDRQTPQQPGEAGQANHGKGREVLVGAGTGRFGLGTTPYSKGCEYHGQHTTHRSNPIPGEPVKRPVSRAMLCVLTGVIIIFVVIF
jgi:hypothetical protein